MSDKDTIRNMEKELGPTDPEEERKLEKEMGIKYRACTGELIFAMVTCRPDISYAVLKLTQYNHRPAKCHYEAIAQIYKYLHATKFDGITYWRPTPNKTLPQLNLPTPMSENYNIHLPKEHDTPAKAFGYVDSDWAADTRSRKSVSGIVIILAGATVIYKTILQKTIALSSTEAEFYALVEAGKLVLYLRSILDDLFIHQTDATPMYEDNQGCRLMAMANKPTRRTRHIDIKNFAIIDWVQRDLIKVNKIGTSDNASDNLTKANTKTLFYRHADTMMGKRRPPYTHSGQKLLHNAKK